MPATFEDIVRVPRFISKYTVAFERDMNVTSILVTNLLSLTNLIHFLDLLITDGNYQTVLLVYDEASVEDTNVISELFNSAHDNYSVVIVNRARTEIQWMKMSPYNLQFGVLEIVLLNCDENVECIRTWLLRAGRLHNRHNMILLIPVQAEEKKREIWDQFDTVYTQIRHVNISVIFYEIETPVAKTNTSKILFEVFVLDYEPFRAVRINVENWVSQRNKLKNQSNWNDKIFETISWKPTITTQMYVAYSEDLIDRDSQLGNSRAVNLGNAELYLLNFIARILRVQNIVIEQHLGTSYPRHMSRIFGCLPSNEKYYAELYNTILGRGRYLTK